MSTSRHKGTPRFVYFAKSGDMVKVGCTVDPEQRLAQIGEWIPFEIELIAITPGTFQLEADLHAYFADSWSHLEWFRITPKIMAVVDAINRGDALAIPKVPRDSGKEHFKTLKKRASRRVTMAEKLVLGSMSYPARARIRPPYLTKAIESFAGPQNEPPSESALAAIAKYEREMKALAEGVVFQ